MALQPLLAAGVAIKAAHHHTNVCFVTLSVLWKAGHSRNSWLSSHLGRRAVSEVLCHERGEGAPGRDCCRDAFPVVQRLRYAACEILVNSMPFLYHFHAGDNKRRHCQLHLSWQSSAEPADGQCCSRIWMV